MSFDQKEIFSMMYKLARLTETDCRVETDAFGTVNVPINRLFGPQTARSLSKLSVGDIAERMPVSTAYKCTQN